MPTKSCFERRWAERGACYRQPCLNLVTSVSAGISSPPLPKSSVETSMDKDCVPCDLKATPGRSIPAQLLIRSWLVVLTGWPSFKFGSAGSRRVRFLSHSHMRDACHNAQQRQGCIYCCPVFHCSICVCSQDVWRWHTPRSSFTVYVQTVFPSNFSSSSREWILTHLETHLVAPSLACRGCCGQ